MAKAKKDSQVASEIATEDTPVEGETSAPDPEQADTQETSTGDDTSDSQAGRDSSRWVPRERFSEVSRERARLKEQIQTLRQEIQELRVGEALHRIGFSLVKPEYASFFEIDQERLFNPDGKIDLGYLKSAVAKFQAEHPELVRVSQLTGSGALDSGLEDRGPDPFRTRKRDNRSYLSKAYGDKE